MQPVSCVEGGKVAVCVGVDLADIQIKNGFGIRQRAGSFIALRQVPVVQRAV